MKRKLYVIACISMIMVVIVLLMCKIRPSASSHRVLPICTRPEKVRIKGRRPALAPNYKLQWDNHRKLMVYFMEGNKPLGTEIVAIANDWSRHCGLSFKLTDKLTDSQIRVTFRSGGYSSAVGLECIQDKYMDQPTMFLEGLDTMKDKQEFIRIVLHEFGHTLGLEHELRKASSKIPWDTAAVVKYYWDHYRWSKQKVIDNIFLPVTVPKEYDEFDSTSIMVYAVPDTLTIGNYSISWSQKLSKSDEKYIQKWYPKQ